MERSNFSIRLRISIQVQLPRPYRAQGKRCTNSGPATQDRYLPLLFCSRVRQPTPGSSGASASALALPTVRYVAPASNLLPALRDLRRPFQICHPHFDIFDLNRLRRVVQNAIRGPHSGRWWRRWVGHHFDQHGNGSAGRLLQTRDGLTETPHGALRDKQSWNSGSFCQRMRVWCPNPNSNAQRHQECVA